MSFNKKKRNKKALSAMIGYILLITFGIVLSVIVYSYLKTYVPKEFIKCPEGVSMFIEDLNCTENITTGDFSLNITLKNNGKFNLAGYFIHGANESTQEIAILDLSQNVQENLLSGPAIVGNSVIFTKTSSDVNSFKPNNVTTHYFTNINTSLTQIEIIPIRYDVKASSQRLASCGEAKIWEMVSCS